MSPNRETHLRRRQPSVWKARCHTAGGAKYGGDAQDRSSSFNEQSIPEAIEAKKMKLFVAGSGSDFLPPGRAPFSSAKLASPPPVRLLCHVSDPLSALVGHSGALQPRSSFCRPSVVTNKRAWLEVAPSSGETWHPGYEWGHAVA